MDRNIIFEQAHVKRFITDELIGKHAFNEHPAVGAHAAFIMRAAKAAGLTVRKIGAGHFFFDGGRCIGNVESMTLSLTSVAAHKIASSKQLTKELLESAGVPVPRGRKFLGDERSKAERFVRTLPVPAVVKPDGGRGGAGVTCGVTTSEHFNEAWQAAVKTARNDPPIIVEEFATGVDLRVYVVEHEVVAAASRLPAHVVGDGKQSLAQLLQQKRELRDRNKYLARMPITVDPRWIANSGLAMGAILAPGEIAVLNSTVNLHQGGENVDVTGILHDEIKEFAVAALAAIPGMGAGGIDFVARSPRVSDGAVVLEVNTGANISVHHLPAYGESVDVGRAIINAMVARASPTPR
ncbi:ATP-binding protein [Brachybacterium tyrofermentans]|uniref:ATP-binding protein n=1 Tax=Brachybacterium tyrofermentans TaxID=47848 RepID=UPI003FD6081E